MIVLLGDGDLHKLPMKSIGLEPEAFTELLDYLDMEDIEPDMPFSKQSLAAARRSIRLSPRSGGPGGIVPLPPGQRLAFTETLNDQLDEWLSRGVSCVTAPLLLLLVLLVLLLLRPAADAAAATTSATTTTTTTTN